MENLLAQLKRRQIFKVATIYVVTAWPLIQIVDVAAKPLGIPDSLLVLLFKVFVVGFPVSLIFAWLINFTPDGLVLASADQAAKPGDLSSRKVTIRAFLAVAGSLLIALVITLASQFIIEPKQQFKENNSVAVSKPLTLLGQSKLESIAVLPFLTFSENPNDEFFVDGMVEELLNLLAKIPDLQVASRTSSFAYKGVKNKSIVAIGKELGVDTILEGSFRKNDVSNTIRVTAQLIDASTGNHFWSETFDREYSDIFEIQDFIANAVVQKMKTTLLGDQPVLKLEQGTNSVEAMVEYGKGQTELAHRTSTSIQTALGHFTAAVKLDNQYASAYVGIADANILLALYGNLPRSEATVAAQQAIDSALTINGELGTAHASQGLLYTESHRNDLAEESFKRAIEYNPSYAMSYMWYGSFLQGRGEINAAHQLFEKAFKLDPKSPVAAFNVAWGRYQLGEEDKAMELFSTIIANDPYYPGAYLLVANILKGRGRLDEAIGMYERALEVDPLSKSAVSGLLIATMDMQYFEATDQWFEYLEDKPDIFSHTETTFMTARYFAAMGEVIKAIDYMSKVEFALDEQKQRLFVEAEMQFYQQNYAAAAKSYELFIEQLDSGENLFFHASEGQGAVHLAHSYSKLGQLAKADELISNYQTFLEQSALHKAKKPLYYYNMALLSALKNKDIESFSYLQGAIQVGWVEIWKAKLEPIFENIKTQERFSQMIGGIEAKLAVMIGNLKEQKEQAAAD